MAGAESNTGGLILQWCVWEGGSWGVRSLVVGPLFDI